MMERHKKKEKRILVLYIMKVEKEEGRNEKKKQTKKE